ncbi:hypothetical protein [Nocardiopsis synnemataformans]|uniref:hypothetical protein n=1 Tax=Nocardiopsis synnemataformans TaxID=61305 RepID=UPI003EBACCC4
MDLAVDIVQEADALYRTGCQNGKNNALYDSVPTIGFGTALHMHKVNDLRILEYTDEEGRTLYVSAMEKPYGWGNPYETFNAALVEAIALSASPGLTCAGALINRMIGLK